MSSSEDDGEKSLWQLHHLPKRNIDDNQLILVIGLAAVKYVEVVTRSELIEVMRIWKGGGKWFWIRGDKIHINDPNSFKMFDVKFKYHTSDILETRRLIFAKLRGDHENTWSQEVLEHFGNDASHLITPGPYGNRYSG